MKKFTDIKTVEDAYKVLGIDRHIALPDYSKMPEKHHVAFTAHADLVIVIEALNFIENNNETWQPNWSNYDERKYYPWFEYDEDLKRLVFHYVTGWFTTTRASSRLCFKSRDLAEYAAKQFEDLYNRYYLLN